MRGSRARDPAQMNARLAALSLRQMRFLVTLADEGSFSRAAARVAVSQPAISAAVRQVEALLDVRLFDRTTHRVALTDAGRSLLPHVRRLLVTADHVFVDIAEAVHRRGVVRVGAIPSVMPILAQQIAALDGGEDGGGEDAVDVHLSDGTSDALLEQVRRGALDLAIGAGAIEDAALYVAPLIEDELLLVVPRGHRFADAGAVAWRELHDREVVHFAGGSIGEITAAAMCQNNLLPSRRYRVDQVGSLFGLVGAGLAIGIMPRLYTAGHAGTGTALVPLDAPRVVRRIVMVSRRALRAEHPAAAALAERLATGLTAALG